MSGAAIELSAVAAAPRGRAWACLTEERHLRAWWNDGVRLDARLGGRFEEPWRDGQGRAHLTRGTVERLEPEALLELSWADDDWTFATRVTFALSDAPPDGTQVALRHAGWTAAPAGDRTRLVDAHRAGWSAHLANLCVYAADPRSA